MKVILETVSPMKAVGDAPPAGDIKIWCEGVLKKAEPGVPYTLLAVSQQAETDILSAGHIVRSLAERGQAQLLEWGLIAFHDRGEMPQTTMRAILDGSVCQGVDCSTSELINWIHTVTGEEPTGNTMRKTLARLVKSERFVRVGTGNYRKTGRGM